MTTDVALRTSAVDPEIAAAMQIFDRMNALKSALGLQDLSDAEMQLFGMVAHRTGLDPFSKQLYAIKRSGKVTHQTGIDGYRSVAEKTREYAGSDEPTYETPCPCGKAPADHPAVARVTVHRILANGHVVDQVGVARWHELYPGDGPVGSMWQKMPFNQLSKCAEANALRKAFPRVLEGVYVTEEMEQAGPAQNAEVAAAAGRATAADRLAARRQALEAQQAEQQADPTVIEGTATVLDELPAADDGDPGPSAPEIRPESAPVAAPPPTPTPPAAAAARPAAAPRAPKSGAPAQVDAPPMTFKAFSDAIRAAGAIDEDLIEAARHRFPTAKSISGLHDDERGRLFVDVMERIEARQAAAASQ